MKDILILENFIEVLASEKGLATNTRVSYKNDILQFLKYIETKRKKLSDLKIQELKKLNQNSLMMF